MLDLFTQGTFFEQDFPEPQYLGAKYIHRAWIAKFIPDDVRCVLDAFGGSQSIAYMMKQMGKRTITNDFMNYSNQIGLALVENKHEVLSKDDVRMLMSPNKAPNDFCLMEKLFAGLFFSHEDAAFIDSFRSNVELLKNPYKKSLAFAVMCRSLTRKVTMGHFAHTQALNYASDPERIKRNRSLVRPVKDLFLEILPSYNSAVFDNNQENRSYNKNILDLLPELSGVDLVYFDPPYCDSHADYQSFYHLLETFVEYWKDKQFVNGTKRYEPKRFSGFDRKSEAEKNLNRMFESSLHIPLWLISYNDRSYPSIDVLEKMITPFRNVNIEKKEYSFGRGGKGSVAGSNEILLICTKK